MEAPTDRRYPFKEGKLFSLTLTAGSEGYHVAVDGRHVSSFPYHPSFALEDATGLISNGDLDIESVHAELLPTSHPSFSAQSSLQMLPELWSQCFIYPFTSSSHSRCFVQCR